MHLHITLNVLNVKHINARSAARILTCTHVPRQGFTFVIPLEFDESEAMLNLTALEEKLWLDEKTRHVEVWPERLSPAPETLELRTAFGGASLDRARPGSCLQSADTVVFCLPDPVHDV